MEQVTKTMETVDLSSKEAQEEQSTKDGAAGPSKSALKKAAKEAEKAKKKAETRAKRQAAEQAAKVQEDQAVDESAGKYGTLPLIQSSVRTGMCI